MTNSYVVVAIPSRDDYIWKLSSEKVPHLTLLYLNADLEDDLPRFSGFVEHVAKTALNKFMLEVRDRGVLGENSADVVFFDRNFGIKRLEEFRSYLMTDDCISKSYNSVEQYPIWTPHLTMGYPKTPAKSDDREYPGVRWVDFDRIALWTKDYEGVEFPLTSPGDAIAQSATSRKGELFLQHYGIKGQKWGVIRKAAKAVSPSEDHVKAAVVKGKAKLAGVHTLSNKDLQTIIKRMDLEVKFKDLKTVQHDQSLLGKGANWVGKVATDILVNSVSSWFRAPWSRGGSSRTGGGSHDRVINGSIVPQRQIKN